MLPVELADSDAAILLVHLPSDNCCAGAWPCLSLACKKVYFREVVIFLRVRVDGMVEEHCLNVFDSM